MGPEPPLPGQTPLDDLSGLKVRGVLTQAQLNALEAENIRRATVKHLAGAPSRRSARFDFDWVLRVHRDMFGDVWAWAGTIRTRELNIGSAAHQIRPDLHNLLDDLRAWEASGMAVVEQAARLHHRAVSVHPFMNGNGRWARMLAGIWLRLHGEPATRWPEAAIGATSDIRREYLEALRAADRGDYALLIGIHARYGSQG